MIKKDILEDKYTKILKYLTYQDLKIDNKILTEINNIDKKIIIKKNSNITRLLNIFKDICVLNNINYLYYIFILENLPNKYILGIFRLFNYKLIKLNNLDMKIDNIEFDYYKLNYKLNDFIKSNNPKNLLYNCLENIYVKEPKILLYFIICINHFFT